MLFACYNEREMAKLTSVSIRIPRDVYDRLHALAVSEDRTMVSVLRRVLGLKPESPVGKRRLK